MNYLAHAFLSGDDPELLLGNFIADSVKGKQIQLYAPQVIKGIKLHRLIDAYTDSHAIVEFSKARLRPTYKKFAPVIVDMFYDHFLASRFQQFTAESLGAYTKRVYAIVNSNFENLPMRMQHMLPHMMHHNWLQSYAKIEGINQALTGMSRRTSFDSGMETATLELERNYDQYASEFESFFPELRHYVNSVIKVL